MSVAVFVTIFFSSEAMILSRNFLLHIKCEHVKFQGEIQSQPKAIVAHENLYKWARHICICVKLKVKTSNAFFL